MAAVATLSVLLTAGCLSTGQAHTVTAPKTRPATFAHTTCAQWLAMSRADQDSAALEFASILHARHVTPSFAAVFARNIGIDCRPVPKMRLAEVVGALATLDTADFGGAS